MVIFLVCIIVGIGGFLFMENHVLREIAHICKEILAILKAENNVVSSFKITQIGESRMANKVGVALGIVVAGTGSFLATPLDVNGNTTTLPAGVIPVWTSSNPAVATVATQDPTGLTAVLTGVSTGTVTLQISATLPGGGTPSGEVSVPVTAGQTTVVSFGIVQTA